MLHGSGDFFSPISHQSITIKRVCRATLQAEAYALSGGSERGFRLRAIIADTRGMLDTSDWENSSSSLMPHVCFTDCGSLRDHLCSETISKIDDKRLSIEMAAMRQFIWERNGVRTDTIDQTSGDIVKWIDTSCMIADPLTKAMKPEVLMTALRDCYFDLTPTAENVARKQARKKAKSS